MECMLWIFFLRRHYYPCESIRCAVSSRPRDGAARGRQDVSDERGVVGEGMLKTSTYVAMVVVAPTFGTVCMHCARLQIRKAHESDHSRLHAGAKVSSCLLKTCVRYVEAGAQSAQHWRRSRCTLLESLLPYIWQKKAPRVGGGDGCWWNEPRTRTTTSNISTKVRRTSRVMKILTKTKDDSITTVVDG